MIIFDDWIRTKWKRQTAVGLELLAEAGNYATLQRLYAGSAAAAAAAASTPYPPWGYPSAPHLNALPNSKLPLYQLTSKLNHKKKKKNFKKKKKI